MGIYIYIAGVLLAFFFDGFANQKKMTKNGNVYICKDIRNLILNYVDSINHYKKYKYVLKEFKRCCTDCKIYKDCYDYKFRYFYRTDDEYEDHAVRFRDLMWYEKSFCNFSGYQKDWI